MPWECTEEELVELCKPFGRVVNTMCNVGANRNQAFVEFVSPCSLLDFLLLGSIVMSVAICGGFCRDDWDYEEFAIVDLGVRDSMLLKLRLKVKTLIRGWNNILVLAF
jgi:hypothetical protein